MKSNLPTTEPIFMVEQLKRPAKFTMSEHHVHDYYELYYLLSGTRKCFINHSFYTMNPHDLILIHKGALHRTTYNTPGSSERIVIYFDDTWLTPLIKQFGEERILDCFQVIKLPIPAIHQHYLADLIQRISTEKKQEDDFSPILLQHLFEELMIFLIRLSDQQTEVYDYTLEEDAEIAEAARYICANYHKEISLEDVASIANISPTYFSKKFKKTTGFGFKEYMNHIRLREATKQLIETKDPITTVALRCGFNDSNYFGDLFRKVHGISPRNYRYQYSK